MFKIGINVFGCGMRGLQFMLLTSHILIRKNEQCIARRLSRLTPYMLCLPYHLFPVPYFYNLVVSEYEHPIMFARRNHSIASEAAERW